MKLHITPIPSNVFLVHRNENDNVIHMIAEISDLGPDFRFHILYDDALDVGMAVQSTKTDAIVHYYLRHTITNSESEVTHWLLAPTTESIRQHPLCENTQITLFND